MIPKKILFGTATLVTAIAPISTAISCGPKGEKQTEKATAVETTAVLTV